MYIAKFILCLVLSVVTVNSARILAWFPTPSISHQVVFRPLTQELTKRGHEVVVLTTDPAFPPGQAPENLTEIDLHDMSYKTWRKQAMTSEMTTGSKDDLTTQLAAFLPLVARVTEMQWNSKEVQNIVGNKTRNFDLLILEAFGRPNLGLSHILKVPLIVFSSLGGYGRVYDIMGAPTRPALIYPTVFRQKINNLSLKERIEELYHHYKLDNIMDIIGEQYDNKIAKRMFGSDLPDLKVLENNMDLLFLNVNPLWELNRPVPPGVVYLGGMHQKPKKELPKELKSYLDSSKHGVIYISYGTNVSPSLLPAEKIQLLIKVFSKLPYNVLWKWDKDELPGKTDNIRISKWLPQSDLLRHPNVKLFITQGGLQSTDEAITAGVPLLGMPMLGDQWYNVEQYVRHKIGLRADMESLTEEQFKNAIETLIKDESYRKNIVKLRSIMHDQPQTSLERAVWWTEYVLRHGGAKHLRAPAANMTWAEYLDVELLAVLAGIALTGLIALSVSVSLVYKFLKRQFNSASKLKKS